MRYGLGLVVLSFVAGLSGCAATSRMDGGPSLGSQAWNQAPAPPQRTVANTSPAAVPVEDDVFHAAQKPAGLAKYFPGLQRPPAESPKVLARYRPTWFGLRPSSTPAAPPAPTNYMTDARAGLNQPILDPATLPVALQVPSPKGATDAAVNPAGAEEPIVGPAKATESGSTADSTSAKPASELPVLGSGPMKPVSEDVNPLPTANEPGSQPVAVVNQMPDVPAVNPQDSAKPANSETVPSLAQTPAGSTADAPKAPDPLADAKAVKAVTNPINPTLPPGLPEPTVPASYASIVVAQQAVGFKKHSIERVYASSQSVPRPTAQSVPRPTAQSIPRPIIKPTAQSQPVPTSLSRPSPQATPSAQSGATSASETTWQRPCLRRLVRKVCKLGEYADPPTAAPH